MNNTGIIADGQRLLEEEQADISTLATGTTVSFGGKMIGRGLYSIGQIVLARLLGPGLFGVYTLGWTVVQLAGAFVPLGLDKGVIRFGSRFWPDDQQSFKGIFLYSFGLAFLFGWIAGGVLFLAADYLGTFFAQPGLIPVLRWFALTFPFLAGMKVLVATSQISRRMKYAMYSEELGRSFTNLVLILLFYVLGYGLLGAVAATVLSFIIAFFLAGYYVWRLFPMLVNQRAVFTVTGKQLLSFSIPTVFADLFLMLAAWANPLFIGYFRPADEVGIYQAVSQVTLLFAIILRAINSIFAPIIADLYHRNEIRRLDKLYKIATKWGIYISIPLFLIVFLAGSPLMITLFGSEYADSGLVLFSLVLLQLINVGTGAVAFMLVMTGYQRDWLIFSILAFTLNAALNMVLIPSFGIIGAATATLVTIGLLNIGGLLYIRHKIHIWPYDKRLWKGLTAGAVTAVFVYLSQLLTGQSSWLALLSATATAVILFPLLLWRLGIESEDQVFVHSLQKRLPVRFRGRRGQ